MTPPSAVPVVVFVRVTSLVAIFVVVMTTLTEAVQPTGRPPFLLGSAGTVHGRNSSVSDGRPVATARPDLLLRVGGVLRQTPLVGCPERCRCPDHHSTVVNCHRAGLRRSPFPLPLGTIVLDLDRNRIGVLTNDSFAVSKSASGFVGNDSDGGAVQLEIVSIQDNGLARIEPGSFASLSQLRILRLGGNLLSVLPVGLFDACRRLQVLDVHDNLLTGAPPDHVMYHVHGLVSFNISRNRLTSPVLGPGFRYVTQLGDIDMSGRSVAKYK